MFQKCLLNCIHPGAQPPEVGVRLGGDRGARDVARPRHVARAVEAGQVRSYKTAQSKCAHSMVYIGS